MPGCGKDLSRDKEYFKCYRVCRTHSNAREVRLLHLRQCKVQKPHLLSVAVRHLVRNFTSHWGPSLSKILSYVLLFAICILWHLSKAVEILLAIHSSACAMCKQVNMGNGDRQRYCQQCSAFHPLERFDDIKR